MTVIKSTRWWVDIIIRGLSDGSKCSNLARFLYPAFNPLTANTIQIIALFSIYANEPIERAPQLSDFAMDTVDIDPDTVTEPGSLLLENLYISLDPYLRGRMKHGVQSYAAPFPLGEPFVSHAISRVLKSNAEGFKAGDLVYLLGRWESHTVYPDASKVPELRVFNPAPGIPLYVYISALGMPGMTAWAGLNILAHPKAGETLFVSAASGAVGQMVVQYGVKNGMRVVGTAGSDEKCEFVKSLGAAECFNYKKPPGGSIEAAVKAACPNGIGWLLSTHSASPISPTFSIDSPFSIAFLFRRQF